MLRSVTQTSLNRNVRSQRNETELGHMERVPNPIIEENTDAEISAASPDESDAAVLSAGPMPGPGIGGAPVRCMFSATRLSTRLILEMN